MGRLDVHAKLVLRARPEALVRLALPQVPFDAVAAEETELPAGALRMDKVVRLEARRAPPRWLVLEVFAAWSSRIPEAVFRYWSRARERFDPLDVLVLVLKPGDRQGRPRDAFVDEGRVHFSYRVQPAWELDAEALLRGDPGLLPLVPYARGRSVGRVERAFRRLRRVQPVGRRADLMGALATFAGDVFPRVSWRARIPEETYMKSSFIDEVKAEGRVEGRVEGKVELVTQSLRERLGIGAAGRLGARLAAADDATLTKVNSLLLRNPPDIAAQLDRLLPKAPRRRSVRAGGRRRS